MINSEFGKIEVRTFEKFSEAQIRFISDFDDSYLCSIDEKNLKQLIDDLQRTQRKIEEWKKKRDDIIRKTNFGGLYDKFDKLYNPYPTQMSRCSAFAQALENGLIEQDVFDAARVYYGTLWNYVGD